MIPVGNWRRWRTEPMEDQIATRLPLLSHLFGLLPWHVQRLTYDEWEGYKTWADEWVKARDHG